MRSPHDIGHLVARAALVGLLVFAGPLVLGLIPGVVHASEIDRTVIVGVYDNPPLSFREGDRWSGVFPDVIDAIAAEQEWDVTYREVTFDQGLFLVEAGLIDMFLAVADTRERRERMSFAETTFITNWGVLSVAENSGIETLDDLAGATIAVKAGDVYYVGSHGLREVLSALRIDVLYQEHESYRAALEAVAAGDADAGLTGRIFAHTTNDELGLTESPIMLQPARLTVAFPIDGALTGPLVSGLDGRMAEWDRAADSPLEKAIQQHLHGKAPVGLPDWLWVVAGWGTAVLSLILASAITLKIQVTRRTRELQAKTAELSALISAIPDTYALFDPDGRIVSFSPGTARVSGCPRALPETHKRTAPSISEEWLVRQMAECFQKVVQTGLLTSEHQPFDDDPSVWYELRATRLDTGGVLVLLRDISMAKEFELRCDEDRRNLKREVERHTYELTIANTNLQNLVDQLEAATRAREQFIANISHELRTPLNSILGFSSVLAKGIPGPLNEEQLTQIRMIQSSGKRLASLVEDLLLFGRFNTGDLPVRPKNVSVASVLTETLHKMAPLAYAKGLSLHTDIPTGTTPIHSDAELVRHVFVSLLSNAIKFTSNGSISVSLTQYPDESVEVRVSDTGPGIPTDRAELIFDEFTQFTPSDIAKAEGVGLGLPNSRRIARLLGGDLTCESEPGRGSTFIIRIAPLEASHEDSPD